MNDKRKLLLFKALKNSGRIDTRTANRIYSGKNGKDALLSLMMQGYLEHKGFGSFEVVKVPNEVKEMYEDWKKSENSETVEA